MVGAIFAVQCNLIFTMLQESSTCEKGKKGLAKFSLSFASTLVLQDSLLLPHFTSLRRIVQYGTVFAVLSRPRLGPGDRKRILTSLDWTCSLLRLQIVQRSRQAFSLLLT